MNTVAGIKNVKHTLYPKGVDAFFFKLKQYICHSTLTEHGYV